MDLRKRALLGLFVAAGWLAGCDPDLVEDADLGAVTLRPGTGSNGGVWLNTSTIGNTGFQEFDLTGAVHDGMRLVSVRIKRPNNVWLTATSGEVVDGNLRVKVGYTVYTGADLVGARFKLQIVAPGGGGGYNGDDDWHDHDDWDDDDDDDYAAVPVEIWIVSHTQVSPKESRYVFQTLDENGQVTHVCDADTDGRHTAIPMRDITVDDVTGDMWPRPKTAYLACTSGAIGKAIDWGYRPWELTLPVFEAATRMVRADYCYNGVSWTETGTSLQVSDKYGINSFLQPADPTEAVWTSSGVACLDQARHAGHAAGGVLCGGQPLPVCAANVSLSTQPGALFWTKLVTPQ